MKGKHLDWIVEVTAVAADRALTVVVEIATVKV